jgi:hypothetical protein
MRRAAFHGPETRWHHRYATNLDATGTSTGPTTTPTGNDELYSFYGFDADIGSAGSTPRYTYEYDAYGNVYAFDPAIPAQPSAFEVDLSTYARPDKLPQRPTTTASTKTRTALGPA